MGKQGKKLDKILLAAGLFLLAAMLASYLSFWLRPMISGYAVAVERNWEVNLPWGGQDLYGTDTGPSVLGDGVRYHVIRWKNPDKLDKALDWTGTEGITEDGKTYTQWLDWVMELLEVPAGERPDPEGCQWWYTYKNNGQNDILICRVGDTLYIAEYHS